MFSERDAYWMQQALRLAQTAAHLDEVPVGAVLVIEDKVIGKGANCPIKRCDPTAHAEIMALRMGGELCQNYRLIESTLYVTLEPCVMCVGALVHARVKRVVYGASDPKGGAVESALQLANSSHFNHSIQYEGGLFGEECGALLTQFFRSRRDNKR